MVMTLNDEIFQGLLLALCGFLFSMALTPFYTHFAYKYKFWKKQKTTTVDGKDLPVMRKLHAHKFKHVFPTMAGLVGVIAVTAVTWIFNLDRGQTWLPLVGFLGGALVGVIDDVINIFGSGRGAAGLRGPVKFLLITIVGLVLGWVGLVGLVVLGWVVLGWVTLCYVVLEWLCWVALLVLCCVVLCWTELVLSRLLDWIVLCCTGLCCVVLDCVLLDWVACAVLCCIALGWVTLCCAMLE